MSHALEVRGLAKSFFGYPALAGVDLVVEAGEVHALVGENGAGKSTLMKILAGVQQADAGTVSIDGELRTFHHPQAAYAAGVSTVYQEFNLLPDRTVAENILLGREPRRFGLVDRRAMRRRAAELLAEIGVDGISPNALVRTLSVAEQQIVEIAKALSYEPRIISMDEPTAALAEHEVELLYAIVRRLSARGVAVLYVSHRMREIFELCSKITVLKDGALVATLDTAETDESEVVRLMVGRALSAFFPEPAPGEDRRELLAITGAGNAQLDGITLGIHRGEILGIAGLQGSGRTELLEAIAGVAPFTRGSMRLEGRDYRPRRPAHGIDAGIAYLTEDRKGSGLALEQSIEDNALAVVRSSAPRRARTAARGLTPLLSELDVSARGPEQIVRYLSGGNQQKVVLAKWLLLDPGLILLDEPTRGIDVGAKRAVYEVMRRLTAAGHAIVMVSSELPEVIGMSDRIVVMRDGRVAGSLDRGPSEEQVAALAAGTAVAA